MINVILMANVSDFGHETVLSKHELPCQTFESTILGAFKSLP
jgi:hypothetical protein